MSRRAPLARKIRRHANSFEATSWQPWVWLARLWPNPRLPPHLRHRSKRFSPRRQTVSNPLRRIHAARVPREYWRHRLQTARAIGLNTVCAYLFWNQIQPTADGAFDWSGRAGVLPHRPAGRTLGHSASPWRPDSHGSGRKTNRCLGKLPLTGWMPRRCAESGPLGGWACHS